MAYDARQIANWFIERAQRDGRSLSIMSLLKLIYIAHGWHLELRDAPLFTNRIEAWQYGPVIPEVYKDFRRQGIDIRKTLKTAPAGSLAQEDVDLLEQIYTIYGKLPPFQLSELTHLPGGPWDIATKAGGSYAHIPDELIRQHYIEKRQKVERQTVNA